MVHLWYVFGLSVNDIVARATSSGDDTCNRNSRNGQNVGGYCRHRNWSSGSWRNISYSIKIIRWSCCVDDINESKTSDNDIKGSFCSCVIYYFRLCFLLIQPCDPLICVSAKPIEPVSRRFFTESP